VLVNIHHDSTREHNRLLVAGVAFLTALALLVWLSIAIYNKDFDRTTDITIKAQRAGLQLAKFGDVRINGVLVGQVRGITQDGQQAEIHVALDPDAAKQIPENVSVQILPTTLFGQKFVALVRPDDPSSQSLADGDVIPADRVKTNVELSRVLAQLFPLLRSVRPADLNATLNALATALDGRGNRIGQTLDELGGYVNAISSHLPTLRKDLVALSDVSSAYDDAAPDLLDVLDNVTVTSKTITEKAADLHAFFSDLTGLSDVTTRILHDNAQDLIRVGQVTEPVLALLDEYSPEFPCLIRGGDNYEPMLSKTFSGHVVKQFIVVGTPQYRVYGEKDKPVYGDVGHGPWCLGLPKLADPDSDGIPFHLDQGTDIDEHRPTSPLPGFGSFDPNDINFNLTSGPAGTDGDKEVVNALLASRSGRTADSYGALGSLLYGPVVRQGKRADG
jgi:phospholipid/cholesterol/gamma-HCH transport system substrate-binding protein